MKKPLTFQAEAPITLLEAINKAEGLTDTAGAEILVPRRGGPGEQHNYAANYR